MGSTVSSFSCLMGKQDHLRDCALLLPLYPSQATTFPLLSSARSTMKQLPPSCLNSTPPLSTILMFKRHPKASGLCQGGQQRRLSHRSQGADSHCRVSFAPIYLESCREFSSCHHHTPPLPSCLLPLPLSATSIKLYLGPVLLLVHSMIRIKTNLFLQGFSKTGQDSLYAAQSTVLLQTESC